MRKVFIILVFITCIYLEAVESSITLEQMTKTGDMMRKVCQNKFNISDDAANNVMKGILPDDQNFKCYINCLMELMQSMRKGKFNYEKAMKQIDMMLPEEFKPAFREALERCKSSAVEIKNHCDASYAVIQCFFENNTKFYFP